jgi:transcriptional regulator with XRE-family HTH domain
MEKNVNKDFGRRVAELRKKAGFSQESFAFQCNIDRTYIGTIERGEKSPTLNTIHKIAQALNMPLHQLFENL